MDDYYVVGVTATPSIEFGCIITIVSKEERAYLVSIAYNPQCTCPDFAKMASMAMGKRGKRISYKHLYYVFRYLCKVDYATDKFIYTPTYNYCEVMHLLQLVGVMKQI